MKFCFDFLMTRSVQLLIAFLGDSRTSAHNLFGLYGVNNSNIFIFKCCCFYSC